MSSTTSSQHCLPILASLPASTSTMQNVKQTIVPGGQVTTGVQTINIKQTSVAASTNTTNFLLNPSTVTATVTPQQPAAKNTIKNEIRYLPVATMPTKQNTRNTLILPKNPQNPISSNNFINNNNNIMMKNGHGPQATLPLAPTNTSGGRIQLLPTKTVNPKPITIPTLTIITPNNSAIPATRLPCLTNGGNILNGGVIGGQSTLLRNDSSVANSTPGPGTTTLTFSKLSPATVTATISSYKVAANNTNSSSPSVITLQNKIQTGASTTTTAPTTIPQRSSSGGITIAKSSNTTSPVAGATTLLTFSKNKNLKPLTFGLGNTLSATAIALSNGLKQRPRVSGNSLLSKDAISQLVKYGQVNAGGAKTFMNVSGNGSGGAPPLAKLSKTIIATQNSNQQQATQQLQQQQQEQNQIQKAPNPNQQTQQQKQNQLSTLQQQHQQLHLKLKQHHQEIKQKQQQQQHREIQQKQQQQEKQQQQSKDNITNALTTNTTVTTATAIATTTSKPPKTYVVKHNPTNKQRTDTVISTKSGNGGVGQHNTTMPVALLDSQNNIRTINIPTDSSLFSTTTAGGGGATGGAKLLPLNKSMLLAAINAPRLKRSAMAVATTEAVATTSSSTQPPKVQSIIVDMPHNNPEKEMNNKQQQQQQQQQIINMQSSTQNCSKSLNVNGNDEENSHSVAIIAKDNINLNNIPTSKASKRKTTIINEKETIIETITINDDDDDDDGFVVTNGNPVNNLYYYDVEENSSASSGSSSSNVATDADYEDNIDYIDEVNNIIRGRDQQIQQQVQEQEEEEDQARPAKIPRNELTEKIIEVTKTKLNDLSKMQKLTQSQNTLKNIIKNINAKDAAKLQLQFLELQKCLMLQNETEEEVNNPITTTTNTATSKESSLLLPANQRIKLAPFARICDEVTISSVPSSSSTNTSQIIVEDATSSLLDTSSTQMVYKIEAPETFDDFDEPVTLNDDDSSSNLEHLMTMITNEDGTGSGAASVGSVDAGMNYVKETSCSLTLNMLSAFRMLKWRQRMAVLNDSNLHFELNEFNLVQLRERCEKRARPASYFERPLFERPNHQIDTTVDPLLYLCKRCNFHGPASEFLAPKFCSISCLRRNSIKRKSNTNLSNLETNDQRKQRRIVQNTDDNVVEKPFRWSDYLEDKSNGYAAPIHLFFNPFPTGPNRFERGMKLEVIDPENCSLFCICTVADIRGFRLKLSFDGYSSTYDFWVNADSMDIFPPGWCSKTKRVLQPPKGFVAAAVANVDMPFDWNTYLEKNNALPAPWDLFTHLNTMSMPITNPFKIGMHLEAEDLNDTGKICVATIADILDERIRVHFDGWDDCYDFWVHISSPYIHPCGWHEGRQQLIVPPDFTHHVFKWPQYIKQVGGIEADPEFFAPREPMDFKSNMKLEVVDQRNPCLIRPATVITRKGYRVQIHLDCWPSEYFFWLEDDSPDLHPIGWCEATAHELEPPPGFKARPAQMPCDVYGCRGFGNAKRFHLNVHALRDCCPYSPENWRTKIVKPSRVKLHEIFQHQSLLPPTKETYDKEIQKNSSTSVSPPLPSPPEAPLPSPPEAPLPTPPEAPLPTATATNSQTSKKQFRKNPILKTRLQPVIKMDTNYDDDVKMDKNDDDVKSIITKPEDIKMETYDDPIPSSSSLLPTESASTSSHLSVKLSTSVEPKLETKKENVDSDDDDNSKVDDDDDNAKDSDDDDDDDERTDALSKWKDRLVADYAYRSARNYKLYLENSEELNIDTITSNPTDWTHWDVFEYIERTLYPGSVAKLIFEEKVDGRSFLQLNQDDLMDTLDIKLGPASKLFSLITGLRLVVANKFKTIKSGLGIECSAINTKLIVKPNDDEPSTSKASISRASTSRASTPRASTPRASTPRASTPRASTSRASTSRASTSRASTSRGSTSKASTSRSSSSSRS